MNQLTGEIVIALIETSPPEITDLTSAVSKANRWLIPSSRGPQDVAQHAAFSALKTKAEEKKVRKTTDQKPSAATKGETTEKSDKLIK